MKLFKSVLSVVVISGILLLVNACKEEHNIDNITPDNSTSQYFPQEIGKYRIYQIDSTIYTSGENQQNLRTNVSIRFKEVVTDTFRDLTGKLAYRVETYILKSDTSEWAFNRVWTSQIDGNQAIATEDNIKQLKLVIPFKKNTTWDPLLYVDPDIELFSGFKVYSGWGESTVLSVDQPEKVGGIDYPEVSTISVVDDEYEVIISRRYVQEKYAKGIGLIYKYAEILDAICDGTSPDCFDRPWEDRAGKGYIVTMTLIEHN